MRFVRTKLYGKAKSKALNFVGACLGRGIMFTRVCVCFCAGDIAEIGQRQHVAEFAGIDDLGGGDNDGLGVILAGDMSDRLGSSFYRYGYSVVIHC